MAKLITQHQDKVLDTGMQDLTKHRTLDYKAWTKPNADTGAFRENLFQHPILKYIPICLITVLTTVIISYSFTWHAFLKYSYYSKCLLVIKIG